MSSFAGNSGSFCIFPSFFAQNVIRSKKRKGGLFVKKKRILSDFALLSIFYVVLGAILLGWPELSGRVICYAFGAVLIVTGLLRGARYFLRDEQQGMARRDLAAAVTLCAGGIFLLARPDTILSLLPFAFGLLLIAGCGGKLQAAADLKRIGSGLWIPALVLGLLSLVLGAVLLVQPFTAAMVLSRFIGASVILEGLENLAAQPIFQRRLDEHYSD